jgi:FixJ family two-component response regulator
VGEVSGYLVAIVEDDEDMRTAIRRVLEGAGLRTETFGCAEALLATDTSSRAQCLVLDIQLSGMSGFELQERLGAGGPPVVFITGHDTPSKRKRALASDALYLVKPFLGETLVAAVSRSASARLSKDET